MIIYHTTVYDTFAAGVYPSAKDVCAKIVKIKTEQRPGRAGTAE